MTKVVDDTGHVREVKRVIDNNQSGDGPKQMVNLRVDGNNLAIALALLACGGVIVGAITLPQLARSEAAAAAAPAYAKAEYAERDARVALDYVTSVQTELARRNIDIKPPNGH